MFTGKVNPTKLHYTRCVAVMRVAEYRLQSTLLTMMPTLMLGKKYYCTIIVIG